MSDSESGGPKQVSDPDYHSENHTAAQTCGWTANALRGEGKSPPVACGNCAGDYLSAS